MSDILSCRIDTTNLMKAQRIFDRHSRWSPSEGLNRTAYFVVKDAMANTPVTTPGRIDADLAVVTTPRISARTGQAVSPRTKNPSIITIPEDSAAVKITLARLHRYSNYNILTDQRYALDQATFSPGRGRAGFVQKILMKAQQMVKARHSSSGFFKSSWIAILKKLQPILPPSYRRGTAIIGRGEVNPELGSVTPAVGGTLTPVCVIENNLGLDTTYPTINALRNMAAHQKLVPVLQASIQREFESKMREADRRGWLANKAELARLGFTVEV